jgi:hypothetical protein
MNEKWIEKQGPSWNTLDKEAKNYAIQKGVKFVNVPKEEEAWTRARAQRIRHTCAGIYMHRERTPGTAWLWDEVVEPRVDKRNSKVLYRGGFMEKYSRWDAIRPLIPLCWCGQRSGAGGEGERMSRAWGARRSCPPSGPQRIIA